MIYTVIQGTRFIIRPYYVQLFLILPSTMKLKFRNVVCVIKPIFMNVCCYSIKFYQATCSAWWLEDEQTVSTAIFFRVNR
jgi:hypothetical protein